MLHIREKSYGPSLTKKMQPVSVENGSHCLCFHHLHSGYRWVTKEKENNTLTDMSHDNSFRAPWHRLHPRRINTIHPEDFPLIWILKSSIAVLVGSDLMTMKAVSYDSHNFHTIQRAPCMEASAFCFSFNVPQVT